MRVRGSVLGLRTLSRFALIGMIGGGTAACSSDASRLGDPFTNPFSSLTGEPSATGSLPEEGGEEMTPAPAIRTPRVQSQALPAPALSPRPTAIGPSPTPAPSRVASAEPLGAVAGMNPDAGRAMTPRASAPVPAPKLSFGKPADRAAKAAEAKAAEKAAEAKREAERQAAAVKAAEAKIAEAKAAERAAAAKAADSKKLADVKKAVEAKKAAEAEAKKVDAKLAEAKKHVRPGQTAKVETKTESKPDPKAEARKSVEAEAVRKAEAEARQAKADAAKKLAEARAAEAAAKAAAKEAKETKQAAAPAPAPTVKVASAEPNAPVAAPAAPAQTAEAFRWPAKGRIINGYGSGGNEGINIAVPEGTPVKAAEDGTVAYAGSDVKGYGKLVLVRHNNGYVSAYAHNGELDVRPGEKVKRGQTIAKSGATGNVTSPQLHFEIRKGATPVDPIPHLASN